MPMEFGTVDTPENERLFSTLVAKHTNYWIIKKDMEKQKHRMLDPWFGRRHWFVEIFEKSFAKLVEFGVYGRWVDLTNKTVTIHSLKQGARIFNGSMLHLLA